MTVSDHYPFVRRMFLIDLENDKISILRIITSIYFVFGSWLAKITVSKKLFYYKSHAIFLLQDNINHIYCAVFNIIAFNMDCANSTFNKVVNIFVWQLKLNLSIKRMSHN